MIFQNNTSLVQWGGNFPRTSCRHLSDLSSRVPDEEKGSPPPQPSRRKRCAFLFLKKLAERLLASNYRAPGHREASLWHSNAACETKSRKNTIFVGRLKYQLIESLWREKFAYSGLQKSESAFIHFYYILAFFLLLLRSKSYTE